LGLDILCVTYFLRYASETVNDVNASCGICSPHQAVNSMSKRSFRWRFM